MHWTKESWAFPWNSLKGLFKAFKSGPCCSYLQPFLHSVLSRWRLEPMKSKSTYPLFQRIYQREWGSAVFCKPKLSLRLQYLNISILWFLFYLYKIYSSPVLCLIFLGIENMLFQNCKLNIFQTIKYKNFISYTTSAKNDFLLSLSVNK
jgi:hypothetical protein